MKKAHETQLQKIFGKLYTISLELNSLKDELEAEHERLEQIFQEIEEKYDNTDDPSDALEKRYEKASDDFDEIDEVFSAVDSANDTLESCIDELIEGMQPDIVEEMKNAIDSGKRANVALPKKELSMKQVTEMLMKVTSFVEDSNKGDYILCMNVSTDIQKKPRKMCFRWNGVLWETTQNSDKLPYLQESALHEYKEKEQEFLATIWENRKTPSVCASITFEEK